MGDRLAPLQTNAQRLDAMTNAISVIALASEHLIRMYSPYD
ncbi:hypothetical protein [Nostoc sp. MG11]|nr:hypothetical protein [Nostoc sp. MG11]